MTQPPNPGRVQLPSIKNLVDTLPPPNAYRSQSTWVPPFHSIGSDSSSNNGPQRNRLPVFPPAMQTPPPRYRPAESPYTATASPSVVFSSASSGTSEPPTGDRLRPLHYSAPPSGSTSDVPMRMPQDPRTNSPISSVTVTSVGSYRTIRPSHTLVSQISSVHHDHQHPHGANLGSRLPMHPSGGATSTPRPTSTPTAAIRTQLNVAPALDQVRGGKHYQNGQDPPNVTHASDRQSHHSRRTFSPPPSSAGHPPSHHFIAPTSERSLPPRIDTEYMDRQQQRLYRAEGGVRNDQIQNRSHSQWADQYPPPTPPWEHHAAHRSSSVRQLDPGDVRSRSTKYPLASQNSNDSHASTTPGASCQSHRTTDHSGHHTSREPGVGDDRGDDHTGNGRGYGLRPARWTESAPPYQPEEMNPRRHEYRGPPANIANNQHGGMHHVTAEDEHGILATRSDRRYQPILPAPSQPQRQYVSLEEQKLRPGPVMMRNRRQVPDAGQNSMHAFSPGRATSTTSPAPFPPVPGIRPPLPKGLIRRRSKDDLGRALQELTNEANHAMAEGKTMKKIHEFARVVQRFSAHYAQYPGPPAPSAEDVEEMSHRAVLIYRMAQAVKAKILAKKAAGNPPHVAAAVPLPSGQTRSQKKKKPITKEEKQVLDDMERIRRKRTAAQQGVKSKYMKRNKKTVAPKQCASCHTKETPEWRKGPDGPRSLCNACGLHWAKLQRKRKEDGQWIGEGAPPPIDIITLRQITGVGLQPRFNERGEYEIPGTYKNINRSLNRWKGPPTSNVVPEVSMSDPSTNEHASTSTAIPVDGAASTLMVTSDNNASPSASAVPTEVNDIAIGRLSMEDASVSQHQPQQQSPVPIHVPTHGHEGRGKKRKASRDHGDRDIDEDETAAPSLKKRRALSPQHIASNVGTNGSPADTGQPPTPVEQTIWQRAF